MMMEMERAASDEPTVPYPKKEDITEAMREGFERLYRSSRGELYRTPSGSYLSLRTEADWVFYQRAWADSILAQASLSEEVPKKTEEVPSLVDLQRRAFIKGWDRRGMLYNLKGNVITDQAMNQLMDVFYPRAASGEETAPVEQAKVPAESDIEMELRSLLCDVYCGSLAYRDDGEMSDARAWPAIDFKRDSVATIRESMRKRKARANLPT